MQKNSKKVKRPKAYCLGMKKQVPPEVTIERGKAVLKRFKPRLLLKTAKIYRSSNIPQYQIIGTPDYYQTVGTCVSNGKGHITEQALASGLMEFIERYSCFSYLGNKSNFVIASLSELGEKKHFEIPEILSVFLYKTLPQVPPSIFSHSRIRWYNGFDNEGKKMLIPFGLLMFMLEGTNGMAAGNTHEEALLQAYCEIIERHCLSLLSDRSARPTIPHSSVSSPICISIMKKFHALGHQIILKDLSKGIGIPVIGVLRIADNKVFLTAGVASSREEALLRALTENSQSESFRKFRSISTFDFLLKKSPTVTYKKITQIEKRYFDKELLSLYHLLKKANMKPYYIKTTHPKLKIPSVFAFISGSKYYKPSIAGKNTIVGLANESIFLKLYNQACSIINYGVKNDMRNRKTYLLFRKYIKK